MATPKYAILLEFNVLSGTDYTNTAVRQKRQVQRISSFPPHLSAFQSAPVQVPITDCDPITQRRRF